jgi:hypothetical protein
MFKNITPQNSSWSTMARKTNILMKNVKTNSVKVLTGLVLCLGIGAFSLSPVSANAQQVNSFPNNLFRIAIESNTQYVVDSYGTNLPAWQTHAHLFDRNQSDKTSAIKAVWSGNSHELQAYYDSNVCLGPETRLSTNIPNGTRAVFKRSCWDTMNHVFINGTIRPRANQNMCLDLDTGGGVKNFSKIQYWSCNGGWSQRWSFETPPIQGNIEYIKGNCYRPYNWGLWSNSTCSFFSNPRALKELKYEYGSNATVTYYASQDRGALSGTAEITRGSVLKFPDWAKLYKIYVHNENQTTGFELSYKTN